MADATSPDPRLLGQRLQEARRAAALTQSQVAERMGMARTTIVAIEKGERHVRSSELVALAEICRRPVSEFVNPRAPIDTFVPQFRATYLDDEVPMLDAAVSELNDRARDYVELERMLGEPPPSYPPPPYPADPSDPERAAEAAASAERNRLGLGDGPVANLAERLALDVGLRIFTYPMPSQVAGLFGFSDTLGPCVALNAKHPPDRRNWTVAHEYGHLLMTRYRVEATLLEARSRPNARERLVDHFATHFLLPAVGLNRRVTELQRGRAAGITLADVCGLAGLYHVSVQAMVLRLEALDRLPRGTWERLKSEGFKPRAAQRLLGLEALEPAVPAMPDRYVRLAVEAYQKDLLSEGQLARFLRMDRVSARLTVERVHAQLHAENGGEFPALSADLTQALGGR
ncbi:MAG TPA: XRE family transcriptional regulator [Terriglobales bacterium]|nr:XRE family transcriptional regulator [Terriglobales bacterium]